MRKYFTAFIFILSATIMTLSVSSCFLFRRKGSMQYRQAPPPMTSTTHYNRKGVKTKTKGRNYKNQYRSDYRGFRGGRDPYHYRGNRYQH